MRFISTTLLPLPPPPPPPPPLLFKNRKKVNYIERVAVLGVGSQVVRLKSRDSFNAVVVRVSGIAGATSVSLSLDLPHRHSSLVCQKSHWKTHKLICQPRL
jgi:hypothetical protein